MDMEFNAVSMGEWAKPLVSCSGQSAAVWVDWNRGTRGERITWTKILSSSLAVRVRVCLI